MMNRVAFAIILGVSAQAHAQYLPPATPEPAPLAEPLLPAPTPSGLALNITPDFTVPADSPGMTDPVARIDYVVADPSNPNRQFVNDTNGTVYAVNNAGVSTPYLNIAAQNVGFTTNFAPAITGFQGIAFDPNFDGDPTKPGYGKFYTTYSATNEGTSTQAMYNGQPLTYLGDTNVNHVTVLREWTATDPNAATFSGTSRVVMTIGAEDVGHNDGSIGFNPTAKPGSADYGLLYIGIGVSGFNDPQLNGGNLTNPAGKILRINPLATSGGAPYSVPADNPFVGQAGVVPEIWAYGLRYPQSFSWDSKTGAMYINDIGQAGLEEVDLGQAGANYGWPYRQGTFATGYDYGVNNPNDQNVYAIPGTDTGVGLTNPIAEYDHSIEYAIGSGFLYNGALMPQLDGMYILQDIVTGDLFYFDPTKATATQEAPLYSLALDINGMPENLVDLFGYNADNVLGPRVDARLSETASGELDIALKANGEVYNVVGAVPVAVAVPEPSSLVLLAGGMTALVAMRRRLTA